ncbi:hypothetical protein B9T39_02885 [Alloscardovia macacae]|uniref:Uncharacterized protein n=2 Tax=Alloscardovia macacae TaxID=1160091 RepID=A0A1Y2T0Z0_9BIFI|nr:hypothetical protein B9T39_02885 [Alloscardovia macacae]
MPAMSMFLFTAWLVSIPDYLSGAWGAPHPAVILLYVGITCYVYVTMLNTNIHLYGRRSLRTLVEAVIPVLATTALMLGFYTNAVFTRFLIPALLLIVGYIFEMRTWDREDYTVI